MDYNVSNRINILLFTFLFLSTSGALPALICYTTAIFQSPSDYFEISMDITKKFPELVHADRHFPDLVKGNGYKRDIAVDLNFFNFKKSWGTEK